MDGFTMLLFVYGLYLLKIGAVVVAAVLLIFLLVLFALDEYGVFKNAEKPLTVTSTQRDEINPSDVQSSKHLNKRPSDRRLWKAEDLF